ncbi:hypothetical protein SAMN04489732_102578 [Amycolatopsis saalfeldensis]|uniref:Uncharacterized protein n=1 Tax=Amycolatopsis saalfeldensis TaxID=394193 RepID=A0A1H8TEL5_9PSEU|nr:hypothetical protein SAMN04489732_102578 [Amycolatopsis saalfeldensis]
MTAGDTATPIFDTVVSEIGRRAETAPQPEPTAGAAAED